VPNPVEGVGQLSFVATGNGNVNVTVVDIAGREVIKQEHQVVKGDNKVRLTLNSVPQGMYFLTLSDDNEAITVKFIKD